MQLLLSHHSLLNAVYADCNSQPFHTASRHDQYHPRSNPYSPSFRSYSNDHPPSHPFSPSSPSFGSNSNDIRPRRDDISEEVIDSLNCVQFVMNAAGVSKSSSAHNRMLKSTVIRLLENPDPVLNRLPAAQCSNMNQPRASRLHDNRFADCCGQQTGHPLGSVHYPTVEGTSFAIPQASPIDLPDFSIGELPPEPVADHLCTVDTSIQKTTTTVENHVTAEVIELDVISLADSELNR